MTQKDPYLYRVDKGEVVSIVITPMNGASGARVTGAIDGVALPNVGSNANLVFTFITTKLTGQRHFVIMSFTFVPNDPEMAYYKIRFTGSNGGEFPGNNIKKKEGNQQNPEYTFIVN